MLIRDGRLLVTPTPELIRHLYENGYSEDEFERNLGIGTTRSTDRVMIILRRYYDEEECKRIIKRRKKNLLNKRKKL